MTENAPQQKTDLPGAWDPAAEEAPMYDRWVAAGYFTADASSEKPPFSIVLPPPNVTGSLHMGHALNHTLMDAMSRRRRMQGYEVLWLPGMDHAGIATQNVVERQLAGEGLSRHDLGREKFVERVWEWKAEYGGKILGQMKRLGDGVDWSRERFTMDENLSKAVQTVFKNFYDAGLIYRAERIINWCPRCQTALSDIEVDHSDDDGELVSIRYGDGDGDASIVVATTRAETMLGDTAVAVHPDDERYTHLVGTEIELPLTGRKIPVVADRHVDPEFGTGAVKVTPAHDPNDFEIGRRHDLPMLTVMNERAEVTVPGPFEGLDRFEARPAVVAALREQGRIVAEKRPYVHAVGHCSRCDTVVEPRLSLQWWVKVAELAQAAGDAVRDGRTKIHPAELEKRYFDWVDNMHDWTISRQLWWGHRIPVWYGPDGEVVCVGPDEQPPSGEGWTQDPDVLDTWFSSGLWPMSTMGWPEETADLAKFYPTSVLSTGYDILFFWVVRMMMFGVQEMDGRQPFDHVYLHGLIRDANGKKMSKSRGNVIDPLEWMDAYGADATRFTLARGANPGADMALADEWAAGSRNFCTKLWNASKFAMMNGATVEGALPPAAELTESDRWILGRLAALVSEVDGLFEDFQFAKVANALYQFTWNELCDWYLELAKVQLYQGDSARVEATRKVLGHVLDTVLRLLHPFIPFVTEKLWTALTGGESLVIAAWPSPVEGYADPVADARIADVQKLITEIRRFRADQGLKPGQKVAARLVGEAVPAGHSGAIRSLVRLTEPGDGFSVSASLEVALAGGVVTVEVDTSGTIDVAAERKRLEKDLGAARKELAQTEGKLGNEAFIAKAPEHVIEKIKVRRETAVADIERIEARLAVLPAS